MPTSLQRDEEQSRRLEEVARELKVDPKHLAKAAINDLVSRRADDADAVTSILKAFHKIS